MGEPEALGHYLIADLSALAVSVVEVEGLVRPSQHALDRSEAVDRQTEIALRVSADEGKAGVDGPSERDVTEDGKLEADTHRVPPRRAREGRV
jgi:hypothetical protein